MDIKIRISVTAICLNCIFRNFRDLGLPINADAVVSDIMIGSSAPLLQHGDTLEFLCKFFFV